MVTGGTVTNTGRKPAKAPSWEDRSPSIAYSLPCQFRMQRLAAAAGLWLVLCCRLFCFGPLWWSCFGFLCPLLQKINNLQTNTVIEDIWKLTKHSEGYKITTQGWPRLFTSFLTVGGIILSFYSGLTMWGPFGGASMGGDRFAGQGFAKPVFGGTAFFPVVALHVFSDQPIPTSAGCFVVAAGGPEGLGSVSSFSPFRPMPKPPPCVSGLPCRRFLIPPSLCSCFSSTIALSTSLPPSSRTAPCFGWAYWRWAVVSRGWAPYIRVFFFLVRDKKNAPLPHTNSNRTVCPTSALLGPLFSPPVLRPVADHTRFFASCRFLSEWNCAQGATTVFRGIRFVFGVFFFFRGHNAAGYFTGVCNKCTGQFGANRPHVCTVGDRFFAQIGGVSGFILEALHEPLIYIFIITPGQAIWKNQGHSGSAQLTKGGGARCFFCYRSVDIYGYGLPGAHPSPLLS